jgi:Rhodopirellula transposase DDE domain
MIRSAQRASSDRRWLKVLSTLNEFQARIYVADKAMDWGRGGISYLSKLTGMSRTTITQTVQELAKSRKMVRPAEGRVRQPGGGRKRAEEMEPEIGQQLNAIVEETTAGDPMSLLRWTSKSTRRIAEELTRRGHAISWMTVARYLQQMGYSLQANRKTREGPQHPNRDAQFHYLHRLVKRFLGQGDPVISVDTKKKELVGAFKNAGRTWRPRGRPIEVHVHDFPHLGQGKAIPYGAYDIARDRAVVNVGITHDTAEFAVESIRRWWKLDGRRAYAGTRQLLICADGGGSNGSRLRAWKVELQQLANQIGMSITVCHYPPGTSKWNQIEHRLFSFISLNWKGQPLLNYETVVNLIGATKTRSGLQVKAVLDTNPYETGNEVSALEFKQVKLQKHKVHPDWNYTISPVVDS